MSIKSWQSTSRRHGFLYALANLLVVLWTDGRFRHHHYHCYPKCTIGVSSSSCSLLHGFHRLIRCRSYWYFFHLCFCPGDIAHLLVQPLIPLGILEQVRSLLMLPDFLEWAQEDLWKNFSGEGCNHSCYDHSCDVLYNEQAVPLLGHCWLWFSIIKIQMK